MKLSVYALIWGCFLIPLPFFFNDTATTEIYTLSLHDALPICRPPRLDRHHRAELRHLSLCDRVLRRSEEPTSELQSPWQLVCRLLLEKNNRKRVIELVVGELAESQRHHEENLGH